MPALTDLFNPRDTAPDPLLQRLRAVTLGEFEIRGELGRGGMAVVYLAKHLRLDRSVAIKVMLPDLARIEGMAERFLQEARISAKLQHPNIIVVHDVQQREEITFFVMSLVDGCGLDEVVRDGRPLPIDDVRWVLMQAAQALAYANREGIVHRDVKPGNILLTVKGDVLVSDFGIAKVVDHNTNPSMSATVIGTPLYMSPEQVTGQRVSEASDQYSLGITAYALLAGNPPFSGDLGEYGLKTAHVRTRPVPLRSRRPDCPPELAAAVMRMLEKRQEQRWPSLQDLVPVLGEGLPHDGLEIKQRLGAIAAQLRDANPKRSQALGITTPVTPRPGPEKPKPATIVVSPPSATLYTAAHLELSARVLTNAGEPIEDGIVFWTTSDPEVATISPSGALVAVGPGTARIRAAIGSVHEEALVTVVLSPITRLEFSADVLTSPVGETIHPVVRAIDAQGKYRADAACSWLSRSPNIVQVVGAGELLALAAGEALVEVAAGTARATLRVRVTARPASSVQVQVDSSTIEFGDAVALRVAAHDDRGVAIVAPRVVWISDAAHIVHVDSTGTAIGLSTGRATITATVDGVRATLSLTVVEAPIASVAMTLSPPSLEPGDTAHVELVVTDASGRPRSEDGITIASDNEAVVRVLGDGRTLTAVAPGDARIVARVEDPAMAGSVTATPVLVSVRLPVLDRVILSSPSLDLEVGAMVAVTARCQDARRRTLANAVVSWHSLNPAVVAVDARGQFRALAAGETIVRVAALGAHDSSMSVDLPVRVRPASVASVRVWAPALRLQVGTTQPLQMQITDSTGAVVTDRAPVWRSSDVTIVRVDAEGRVEAVMPGQATISATLDGHTGDVVLTVDQAPLTALRIVMPEGRVVVGDDLRCRVQATDIRGDVRDVRANWSVVPPGVASVDAEGRVRALRVGTCALVASVDGLTDERGLTITAPTVARVAIETEVKRLRVGATVALTGRAFRDDGRIIDGVPLQWSVSDGDCLQVKPDGSLTALRAGTAQVRVAAGDAQVEATVVVPPAGGTGVRPWMWAAGALATAAIVVFVMTREGPTDKSGPTSKVLPAAPEGVVIQYQLPEARGLPVGSSLSLRALTRSGREPVAGVQWSVFPDGVAIIDGAGVLVGQRADTVQVTVTTPFDSVAVATIAIVAKTDTLVAPPVVKGRLVVTGLPAGGSVRVNRRLISGTSVELDSGRYTVRMQAAGYETVTTTAAIGSGETTIAFSSKRIELPSTPAVPGALELRFDPFAKVFVDDSLVAEGRTKHFMMLPAGRHRLRLEKPGYLKYETDFVVRTGDTVPLLGIKLRPETP